MRSVTKYVGIAVAAAAAVAVSSPASAVTTSQAFDGDSGTFSATSIEAGDFTHVFNFAVPTGGTADAVINTVASFVGAINDVNFSSVDLNGFAFDLGPTGKREIGTLDPTAINTGPLVLTVKGSSGGAGSYSGTFAFMAAVPEPATWALMIGGFGVVGGMMRRRNVKVSRVTYANA